jgi:rieske iron-sulfur protein
MSDKKKEMPFEKQLRKLQKLALFPYYTGKGPVEPDPLVARPASDPSPSIFHKLAMVPYYNGPTSSTGSPAPPVVPLPMPIKLSRRNFLTIFTVVGGLLALAPWVPFGTFLSASAGGATVATTNQTIVLDENTLENGSASGKTVNVNDLTTFPPNSTWIMTYPSSGNPLTDGQNPNTFVKFGLIRLPKELGGANTNASAFVAFSKVCVHLWCSPNFNPQQCLDSGENGYTTGADCATHWLYECPCHGSGYSVGLGQDGKGTMPVGMAIIAPASVQPPPTNAIPLLTLTTDPSGNLQVVPAVWDVDHNGVIGYGRVTGNGAFVGGYNPQ